MTIISFLNPIIGAIIGAVVGRFIAFATLELPKILMDENDEREPRDLITQFFLSKKSKQPHGKRFLILECITALLFGVTLAFFPLTVSTVFVLATSSLLIAAFITDYEHGILPDQITLTLLWLGLIGSLFPVFVTTKQAILGAVLGYGIFWGVNEIYKFFRGFDGMFPGDFKLNAAIGAIVGIRWLIPIILISFVLLVLISTVSYILRQRKIDVKLLHQESPYGCYSSITTIAVFYLFFSSFMSLQL